MLLYIYIAFIPEEIEGEGFILFPFSNVEGYKNIQEVGSTP